MASPVSLLMLQFLTWVSDRPRTYADTMEAWRSTCPRQSVWEDAIIGGLVQCTGGRQGAVALTLGGQAALAAGRNTDLAVEVSSPPISASILIVEDDALLAMELETLLQDWNYRVVGPAATVQAALTLISDNRLDAALLDVNLSDGTVFPLADVLDAAGVPFVLVTGHSPDVVPNAHRHRGYVTKPFSETQLLGAISSAIAANIPSRPPGSSRTANSVESPARGVALERNSQ